jgi:hypothetical protein
MILRGKNKHKPICGGDVILGISPVANKIRIPLKNSILPRHTLRVLSHHLKKSLQKREIPPWIRISISRPTIKAMKSHCITTGITV